MRLRIAFFAIVLACVASLPLQAQVKYRSSVQATYRANTAEAAAVKRWLIDRASRTEQGQLLGDFDSLGETTVRVDTPSPGNTFSDPYPPVPLPAGGSPGQTIGISSCGGEISQQWVYLWVGTSGNGGWVLQSYSSTRVKSCASNA